MIKKVLRTTYLGVTLSSREILDKLNAERGMQASKRVASLVKAERLTTDAPQ